MAIVDGRVVELELESVGLTDAVPADIGQLTSLRNFYLFGNQLTSLPAEIGQLTSLKKVGSQPQSADECAGGDPGSSRR